MGRMNTSLGSSSILFQNEIIIKIKKDDVRDVLILVLKEGGPSRDEIRAATPAESVSASRFRRQLSEHRVLATTIGAYRSYL